jgi:hypothetical protein
MLQDDFCNVALFFYLASGKCKPSYYISCYFYHVMLKFYQVYTFSLEFIHEKSFSYQLVNSNGY